MANEKDKSYKTSITVRISEKNLPKWRKIDKQSAFVNDLITDYLSNKLTKLSLPNDVLEKFNECDTKEYLVNKLLIEYFRDNVMFVDDFVKINSLQEKIGITSKKNIDIVPKTLNETTLKGEIEVVEEIKKTTPISEIEFIQEVNKEEDNIELEESINEESFKDPRSEEVVIKEEPLQIDNIQVEDTKQVIIDGPETVAKPITNKNVKNVLFKRR